MLLGLWAVIAPPQSVRAAANPPHIMIVLMENHSYESVVGNGAMPFVNGLVNTSGSVKTTDLSHPSLPNYLGLVSGSIQNNPQDTTPQDGTYPGPQFTDELASSGISWKAYNEDMPQPCDLTDTFSPGHYDVNHNPFMYFNSVRGNPAQCNRDVPYTQLAADLSAGAAPSFIWVSPNTINDMHDGTDAQGDQFLQGLVTMVRGSSWWTPNSRIVITWDEGTQSEQVLTVVVGSPHGTAANGGNEYGTLRGLEEAYGVGLLGHSADSNVGDIRPLLAGSSAPPPPPAHPSPAPSPSPTPTPTPSPSLQPPAHRSSTPMPPTYFRGVYGKDSSTSGFEQIAASGFNTVMTDPYKEVLDPLYARGLKGIVWLGAWQNSPACRFERDDATIRAQVAPIAGHKAIALYYLGDEPKVSECPGAPTLFKQRTALVHALDPSAYTFTVIQAFENGVSHDYAPWVAAVDILGLDVYPCSYSAPSCNFADIDNAITAIGKAGISRYLAVVQDFQDCYYRLPSSRELATEFDHWAASTMSGYLVFSWNYKPSSSACVGTSLEDHPDNVARLRVENARDFHSIAARQPAPRRSLAAAIQALSAGAIPLAAVSATVAIGVVVLIWIARPRRRRI